MDNPFQPAFDTVGCQLVTADDVRAAGANGLEVIVFTPGGKPDNVRMTIRLYGPKVEILDVPGFTVETINNGTWPSGFGLEPCNCPPGPDGRLWMPQAFTIMPVERTAQLCAALATVWVDLILRSQHMFCPDGLRQLRAMLGV